MNSPDKENIIPPNMVYADHASTAYPPLFHATISPNPSYANPAASHVFGRTARTAANEAVDQIARALSFTGVTDPTRRAAHFVTTSGGTESDNLVLLQPGLWSFIILLPTEHHAITLTAQWMANHHGCELVYLAPDGVGRLDPSALAAALRARQGRAGIVTVAAVNNEIGTVQNLTAIGATVTAANANRSPGHRVWFHTDAVQAPGHVPIDLDGAHRAVDFLSLSAHKFHGPPGFGLLFCRTPGVLQPRTYGGSQQNGLRPGTEAVALLIHTATALTDATDPVKLARRVAHYRELTALVWDTLLPSIVSGRVLPTGATAPEERAPNHVSFCVRGAHRRDIVRMMEDRGVAVSGGSACNATANLPSHVLAALNIPADFIHGSVRITFSHTNTVDEVRDVICPALRSVLQSLSGR